MADYAISNVPRRVVYAASGVGPYAFTFEILAAGDIAVYKASTLLTLTTDYTVTINANGTGSVTLVVTAGTSNITIVGSKTIARTTDFTTGGDFFANTLNDELDAQTIFIQQVAETAERGLKAPVVDPTDIAMTLPSKDNRKGKVLAFDSTTGNPVAGPALDAVVTVIEQSANINTVADNIASVNTVAGNTSNINTVAGVSGSVTTVATNVSNVNTVADDLNEPVSEINTVAVNIANVNTVGTNIANVNTVAGINAAVSTVATNATSVNTVSTNIANVNATGSNIANVNAVGADLLEPTSEINTVAVDIANVNTVGTNIANVNTVAGISANVTSVAGNSTNINTVATNIANVNSVGGNIANVNSVAGNATNINTVAGISANVTTVAGISSNVTTVATNNANVTTVAGSIANVNTNATNIANINQNAANIVAIQGASANATAAANSATAAAGSATSASASAAAASAVALGNEPVRHSVRPSLLLDFANTKTLDPRITFTRASTGTFYDGKTVAKAEENLIVSSQTFDTNWTAERVTITANSVASPDLTTTAETITATATTGTHLIQQPSATAYSIVSGLAYTISIFAKKNTNDFLQITTFSGVNSLGSGRANFDLATGVVGTVDGGTSTITSVGNGWYRCTYTVTASASGAVNIYFGIITSSTAGRFESYAGVGTESIYIWGAQLEQRSTVTAYTATTTAPITNYIPALQTAASGVARFEHNPVTGESLGLEIEEQRTNLLVRSEEFDNAAWSKLNTTASANTIIAPDGTLTGDKLVANSGSSIKYLERSLTIAASTTHTFSVYMKAGEYNTATIYAIAPSSPFENFYAEVNLTTGAVSNINSGGGGTVVTATATSVGNGWWRVALTGGVGTKTTLNARIYPNTSASFTGNDFSGIYIWGAQLEAGAFATSYIPTVASQVTRSADSASMTGTNFSSWYRADEGTLYAEGVSAVGLGSANQMIASIGDGAANQNQVTINRSTAAALAATVSSAGAVQSNLGAGVTAVSNTNYKFATVYKVNDFAFSVNGNTIQTDTSGQVPVVANKLDIGNWHAGAGGTWNSTIKKVSFYAKRLTNAELVSLSTV